MKGAGFPIPIGQVIPTPAIYSSLRITNPTDSIRRTTAAMRGATVWYLSDRSLGDGMFPRHAPSLSGTDMSATSGKAEGLTEDEPINAG
jgi:hypothetical protein